MKKLLVMLLCCLLLAGCAGKTPETDTAPTQTQPTQTEGTEAAPTEESTIPAVSSDELVTFTVYTPNENYDGFIATDVSAKKLSLLEALTAAGVLNENVSVNSVALEETVLKLDMNSAFADLIYTQGTTGERMIMGCLVNTFLSAYDAETVELTVDGAIFESGHVVYDFPMGFFE